ncbi:MAG: nitrilase-related carbon-nitrogen hydrolase, partial [Armatimonadota bacterium]
AQGQRPGTAETYQRMLSVYAELFQVHVLFCNRVGCEEGVTFWGGSVVVGPDGQTIAQAPYLEEARLTAEIDPGLVRRERARTQLLSEERIDLTLRELQRIARERFGTEPTTP